MFAMLPDAMAAPRETWCGRCAQKSRYPSTHQARQPSELARFEDMAHANGESTPGSSTAAAASLSLVQIARRLRAFDRSEGLQLGHAWTNGLGPVAATVHHTHHNDPTLTDHWQLPSPAQPRNLPHPQKFPKRRAPPFQDFPCPYILLRAPQPSFAVFRCRRNP